MYRVDPLPVRPGDFAFDAQRAQVHVTAGQIGAHASDNLALTIADYA